MRVRIPSPLHAYTGGKGEATAEGATLAEALADLDRQYPGLRFRMIDEQDRMRPHMKVFVDGKLAKDLGLALTPASEVMIVAALSGG